MPDTRSFHRAYRRGNLVWHFTAVLPQANFRCASSAEKQMSTEPRRIRGLIANGKLQAVRVGIGYVIRESDLKIVAERKNGRPARVNVEGEMQMINLGFRR